MIKKNVKKVMFSVTLMVLVTILTGCGSLNAEGKEEISGKIRVEENRLITEEPSTLASTETSVQLLVDALEQYYHKEVNPSRFLVSVQEKYADDAENYLGRDCTIIALRDPENAKINYQVLLDDAGEIFTLRMTYDESEIPVEEWDSLLIELEEAKGIAEEFLESSGLVPFENLIYLGESTYTPFDADLEYEYEPGKAISITVNSIQKKVRAFTLESKIIAEQKIENATYREFGGTYGVG